MSGYKDPPIEHQFSSTNQPENNGRKPNKLKKYIDDNGLSSSDITAAIKHVLPLTEEEIKTLGEDKEAPILMRMFVSAIASDVECGTVNNLMRLLDRAFGSPKQDITHTIDDSVLDKLQQLYDSK